MVHQTLIVGAFVLELLAAVGVPTGRVNLMAAGLACYFLALLIG